MSLQPAKEGGLLWEMQRERSGEGPMGMWEKDDDQTRKQTGRRRKRYKSRKPQTFAAFFQEILRDLNDEEQV